MHIDEFVNIMVASLCRSFALLCGSPPSSKWYIHLPMGLWKKAVSVHFLINALKRRNLVFWDKVPILTNQIFRCVCISRTYPVTHSLCHSVTLSLCHSVTHKDEKSRGGQFLVLLLSLDYLWDSFGIALG